MEAARRRRQSMGHEQASAARAAASADAGVSGYLRGQPSGSGRRRTGDRPHLYLYSRRHAAGNECDFPNGNYHPTEHHARHDRIFEHAPSNLHRCNWPKDAEPSFMGYSIGKWIDEDGRGRYNVLEVETRNLKGPRAFDASGIPLHTDNQTVVKERIYLDKSDPNI